MHKVLLFIKYERFFPLQFQISAATAGAAAETAIRTKNYLIQKCAFPRRHTHEFDDLKIAHNDERFIHSPLSSNRLSHKSIVFARKGKNRGTKSASNLTIQIHLKMDSNKNK